MNVNVIICRVPHDTPVPDQNISISLQHLLCHLYELGKPHTRMMHVQTEFCQIAFQPPPPQANGRFVAGIFRRKLANSLKQRF